MEDADVRGLAAALLPDCTGDPEAARVRAKVMAALVGPDEHVGPAPRIGRFVLLHRLGEGGMGVVWAAYDPELDRRVAIKLLREPRPEVAHRLLREAQAMAKLAHPHVAAIYDVGTHEDQVFLALELVVGRTLRQWTRDAEQDWRAVVAAYVQAGRGLSAAHALGVVHRDFKPDNAIRGADGRVRVVDFGLAAAASVILARDQVGAELADVEARTAGRLGTPAYMAAEQFRGREVDARTDQLAFCISLWEALAGERPFAGNTPREVEANVVRGNVRAMPPSARVPRAIVDVVTRGLAVAPDDRHPSMDALLAALERAVRGGRRRVLAVPFFALPLAIAAGWAWDEHRRVLLPEACAEEGAAIAETWNDAEREWLRGAIDRDGTVLAREAAERVLPRLDAYAQEWSTMRTELCIAASVERSLDAAAGRSTNACLDQRRAELEALVLALGDADPSRIAEAASSLGRIAACLDVSRLSRLPAPPPADRSDVQAIRADQARVRALRSIAAYDDALALARTTLADSQALAWSPMVAEAHLDLGFVYAGKSDWRSAERELESAYFVGIASGADDIARQAADTLVLTVGSALARPDDGERWARHAQVLLAVAPDPSGLAAAEHDSRLANLRLDGAALDDAKALADRALVVRERALGEDHIDVARSRQLLGRIELRRGAFATAAVTLERALEILERTLGPHHPEVAMTLETLAFVRTALGDTDTEKRLNERALAIREAIYGPDSVPVAISLGNLALWHWKQGDYAAMKRLQVRAVAIQQASLGPDDVKVALAMGNLAVAHRGLGELAEAKAVQQRALAIVERVRGPRHPAVANALTNVANVDLDLGDAVAAERGFARALAITEDVLGADHPDVAERLVNLASVRLTLGRPADARALYERAAKIVEHARGPDDPQLALPWTGLAELALVEDRARDAVNAAKHAMRLQDPASTPPRERAEVRCLLARALRSIPDGDRARARELRAEALELYARAGGSPSPACDEGRPKAR